MKRAIDVSRWQGAINWAAVRASGVAGAWIKVGGSDGGYYSDGKNVENRTGAQGSGLPFGTYYFAQPSPGSGAAQARHAVDCGHGQGLLWPALDLEIANGMNGPALDAFALDFCNEVRRLTGRTSIIYTGAWIGTGGSNFGYGNRSLAQFPLWIANYGANRPGTSPPNSNPPIPSVWPRWDIWQFNSTTTVPGIPSNTVDQNVVTDELWARMVSGGGATFVPGTPSTLFEEVVLLHPMHDGSGAQYFLFIDGNGCLRRVPIVSQTAASVLAKGGACLGQNDVIELTDPAEKAYFNSIPIANEQPNDVGALRLAILNIEQTKKSALEIIAAVGGGGGDGGDYDIEAAAQAAVDELTARLVRGDTNP